MDKVIYNVGFKGPSNSGVLSWYPQSFDCTFSEFAEMLREQETIEEFFRFAKDCYVPPSMMLLLIRIEDETNYWEYTIKMINIREYRQHWEKVYDKTWKEPIPLVPLIDVK